MDRRAASVLVVEDEPAIALMLERMLEELGFTQVQLALSLADAGRVVAAGCTDVVILDVNVGREAVFPLARILKVKGVPFLFSTACARGDIPAEWSEAPLVRKPAEKQALSAALRELGFFDLGHDHATAISGNSLAVPS